MELTHEFEVGVPVERAWAVLTDVERIAPCLPGAQLQEVDGDEYRGVVKVKVGPITAQYKGKATFVERDETVGRAVLEATGRDTRGQGNASATISAQLEGRGATTHVALHTDLTISGKVAQFGRGALADVSQKLLGQFVENLETTVLAGADTGTGVHADDGQSGAAAGGAATPTGGGGEPTTSAAARPSPPPGPAEVEPIDLLQTAGAPVLERLLPLVGLGALVLVVVLWRRRRRRA